MTATVRVGLYGLLGYGNIGNDASCEAVLEYLRARHPSFTVDAMCPEPEAFTALFGLPATRMESVPRGLVAARLAGKAIDAFRTAAWVRRHDVVIVPGMGVLESTLPLGPAGMPYGLFLLGVCGRLLRTSVALVSVGANAVRQPLIRWLFDRSAALARYRSYRDAPSRAAMAARGHDVSGDRIYPDLVFSLPAPAVPDGDPAIVGMGLMAYYGSNDDRARGAAIHAAYLAAAREFITSVAASGRTVHLYTGDNGDALVLAEVRSALPDLFAMGRVVVRPARTFAELTDAMAPAGLVVATRFHNIICALRLGRPIVSLGYSAKSVALMTSMGLDRYYQQAGSLHVARLLEQVSELEQEWTGLREGVVKQVAANAAALAEQFDLLDAVLFTASRDQ